MCPILFFKNHSTLQAKVANSGYSGFWAEDQAGKLNNWYYRILVNQYDWAQVWVMLLFVTLTFQKNI